MNTEAQQAEAAWDEIKRYYKIEMSEGEGIRIILAVIEKAKGGICDQCSRKIEDGALYEDHSAAVTLNRNEHKIANLELHAAIAKHNKRVDFFGSNKHKIIIDRAILDAYVEEVIEQNKELKWLRAIHGGTLKECVDEISKPLVDALLKLRKHFYTLTFSGATRIIDNALENMKGGDTP